MSKALIKLGSASLAKQAPTLKAHNPDSETEDKQPITNFNKWLEPLSDETFISIFRLLKMPSYLAVPVMQIAAIQSTINTKKSIWKQLQYALKSFCPLVTKWSIKDTGDYQQKYKLESTRLDTLRHRHRLQYNYLYSDCLCGFDYLFGFKNQQFEVWFLSNKLLESKIFKERLWNYNWFNFNEDEGDEDKDPNELVNEYIELLNKPFHEPKLTAEQEEWGNMYSLGFDHKAEPKLKNRASKIIFACAWGARYDSDIISFYLNWVNKKHW